MRYVLTTKIPHYFYCSRCGLCCRGSVQLSRSEYERLLRKAKELKLPINVQERFGRYVMRPIDYYDEKKCTFLTKRNDEYICLIYPERPTFCRFYPLYPGYSRSLDTIFIDILHCPNTTHERKRGFYEITSNDFIYSVIRDVKSCENDFINVLPDLDKPVILFVKRGKVVYSPMIIKYNVVSKINEELCRMLKSSTNIQELVSTIISVQLRIKKIILNSNDLNFNTNFNYKDLVINNHIVLKAVNRVLKELFPDNIVIYDHVNSRMYKLRPNLYDILSLDISSVYNYISEIFLRLPSLLPLYYIPLENMYLRGYLALIIITSLYLSINGDEVWIASNVDAVGLPLLFNYLVNIAQKYYSTI